MTNVNNPGSANAAPTIALQRSTSSTGAANVYQIRNYTTGDVLYFAPMPIAAGERITIVLEPLAYRVVSSLRGTITASVLPPSAGAAFTLQPGTNTLAVLATGSSNNVSGDVTATIQMYADYLSIEDVP